MGIPSYFNFILKNHKNIIINKKNIICDYLFIDSNSLIYDSIHELESIDDYSVVYNLVYNKILDLIKINNPTNKTYVCFDGLPPYPKIIQQKQRRFKSLITNKILNKKGWSTNNITPGTDFMIKLDEFLHIKFKNDKNIYLSGSSEEGEGEHKICSIIRNNIDKYNNSKNVIYGLDADLIMLGLLLSTKLSCIYLYKETTHFSYLPFIDNNEEYYFNLKKLAFEIDNTLENYNIKQSVYDYCLICFLCGNDFLPHLPAINIRNNGIFYLIEKYKQFIKQNKLYLINNNEENIQWDNFRKFILTLSNEEDDKIKENILWKLNLNDKIKPYTYEDKLNLLPCVDNEKEKYLLQNMDSYNSYILNNVNSKEVSLNYLKMIEWTWKYYLGFNVCNNIFYNYFYGPLLNDIKNFIPIYNNVELINTDNDKESINTYTQLLYVLPYNNHKEIIPKNIYNKISGCYNKFPILKETNYEIEYFLCKYFWESHIHLEHIDIYELNKEINQLIN